MPDHSPHVKIVLSLITVVIVVGMMYILQSILIPLLFSILISVALLPLATWMDRGLPRVLSAILSVIIAFALLGGLIWFIVNQVIEIGSGDYNFAAIFDNIVTAIQGFLTDRLGLQATDFWDRIKSSSMEMISNATGRLTSFFGSAGNLVAHAVLVPLFVFFILYYRTFFIEFFYRVFSSSPKEKIQATLDKMYIVIRSYLFGLITVMGIVAVLNTAGLMLLKIDYAWFFGTLAALLLLIPYIGIAIGSIIPALFALATKDSAYSALGVIVWFQVVQFLEGNFITPNIVGGKVNINPMFAIIALFLGGKLFGLAGLILAMPMVAVLKVLLDASTDYTAFGYLLGEPSPAHLKKGARKRLLSKLGVYPLKLKKEKKDKD